MTRSGITRLFALIAFCCIAATSAAFAQQQMGASGQDVAQELAALRQRTHAEMLAALTPEHRNLVAKLKASTTIDPDKAAKIIDDALSAKEVQAVLAINTRSRAEVVALLKGQGTIINGGGEHPDPGKLLLEEGHHLQMMH